MPKDNSVYHGHDAIFKNALANKKVAQQLFQAHLPKKILKRLDLDTIELLPNSFVDSSLRSHMADVLFKVNVNKKPGLVSLILGEHLSNLPEKIFPLRMVRYLTNGLESYYKNHDQKLPLPPILIIVFYNGQKPFTSCRNFFDLFESERDLMKNIFLNDFPVVEFSQIPDKKFANQARVKYKKNLSYYILSKKRFLARQERKL